jgi:hypothetical protein
MIISKSKNFIFIHLEKCGGTSIEAALEPHLSWDDIILGSTEFGTTIQIAYEKRFGRSPLSKHSTAQEIKEYLKKDYESMYKFATVRDPIELVTSLYFYSKKIVDNFIYQNKVDLKYLLDWTIKEMPTQWKREEVFHLNYLLSEIDDSKINGFVNRMIRSNHHSIAPQTWRLTPDVEIFDISTISDHWEYILDKLNIQEITVLEKLNISTRNKEIKMSGESVKLIKKHFAPDYKWIPESLGVNWNG